MNSLVQVKVTQAGAVPRLVHLCREGAPDSQRYCALAMANMSAAPTNHTALLEAGALTVSCSSFKGFEPFSLVVTDAMTQSHFAFLSFVPHSLHASVLLFSLCSASRAREMRCPSSIPVQRLRTWYVARKAPRFLYSFSF